ncbi:hypothetical protein ZIOFF_034197 [Zingiber officinale]|uniref:S5 DRBM domain-containing protein n=1 Tax=Zingiber officinale TaxID=94328 RepID=A0A8J5GRW5_ZINOF|nr:hypothetical protein ZIOFF_034197 [Zingiber officinale]
MTVCRARVVRGANYDKERLPFSIPPCALSLQWLPLQQPSRRSLLSLSLHPPSRRFHLFNTSHFSSSIRFHTVPKLAAAPRDDIDTSFFDNLDPNAKITFEPAAPPEGYVPAPAFDELPPESEEAVAAAFEEIYGPAYSGESVIGNDIYVMDAKLKTASGLLGSNKREKPNDGFEERVVQKGHVGVGVGKAKEVVDAIFKSAVDARRNIVTVPMTKYLTFSPVVHRRRLDGDYGAAKVMLRPSSPGTGNCRWCCWNRAGDGRG